LKIPKNLVAASLNRVRGYIVIASVCLLLFQAVASGPPEHPVSNIFRPLATPAKTEFDLAMLVFAITGAIFAAVGALIVYTIFRFRDRSKDGPESEPPQVYGSNRIEIAWTVIPILIVFVLAGVSTRAIWGVENASPPKNALQVTVIGHQFWWEVHYPHYGVVTANEIHIPVSRNHENATYFELKSVDVIHSLWVPELGGKTDLIPNRVNHMWLDPNEPGVYRANCTEFCGVQHANMLLQVVAEEPADFERWTVAQQKAHQSEPAVSDGQRKFQMFVCNACHTIKGTRFVGKVGPDLTHLMSRRMIGSGVLPNNHEGLRDWIANPQSSKPGCLMPALKLAGKNLDDLTAFMETLN
jgi:cytochrome c oxidase subunit 2